MNLMINTPITIILIRVIIFQYPNFVVLNFKLLEVIFLKEKIINESSVKELTGTVTFVVSLFFIIKILLLGKS